MLRSYSDALLVFRSAIIASIKKPRFAGRGFRACGGRLSSGDEGLTSTLDHSLQRLCAGVLIGVQAFAVTSDAVFVDDGEAEAAFASGHDQAVHRGKSMGKRVNCMLSLSIHIQGVS
ncbi:hypothetical protein KPSA1_05461 [Pseudomonas syringae pv. actinidiae]|uniref:Uncharacterized protein n=1 Tax=Pseudomonas syringae pv. actinidiae TaxID=103796 RepID=A0A2V0QG55_PSESF|nr:hypothetical protein KPSA1_05461 [Pseudomonas syringae pv. actinidiae]